MLLTVEKVALLKKMDIFAGTPTYMLAAIGRVIQEVNCNPGETFIEEGAVESCMYIVVEGKVRAHKGERTLLTLGPDDIVGELAVLDPEPRSASVTALEPTLLLRLNKGPLDEVLAERPEIALGVIRALTRRIRLQGQLMTN